MSLRQLPTLPAPRGGARYLLWSAALGHSTQKSCAHSGASREERIRLLMRETQDSGLMPCRRKWQPTLVLLAGESHGQRSLVGCRVHGVAKESDENEHAHILKLKAEYGSLFLLGNHYIANFLAYVDRENVTIHSKAPLQHHYSQTGLRKT